MLVVSRNKNEGVVLIHRTTGERIEFLVTSTSGSGRCRIGIAASQDWKILRTPELIDEQGNPIPLSTEDDKE